MKHTFTKEKFAEFFRLVELGGSCYQMDRINSRMEMPGFIEKTGRDKCDEMYALIEAGVTPSTLEVE